MTRSLTAAASALLVMLCSAANADEGMWTFHGFPFDKANSALKTRLDQAWLDRVRSATVRLSNCTGSFVSGNGLVLTNHHCVESCLAELSSKEKSLVEDGFLAAKPADEKRCQTQVADILVGMEDISPKVAAAIAGKDDKAANEARKATLTQLESACEDTTKRKCQAVTLYEGGQYWMYQYQRYTDVRIVFAPEGDIAAFGGDPDNFQFPRWCLDMGILRVYDAAGKPVKTPNHLKINFAGPGVGDPVFVSGHPGSTDRLLTVSELQAQRNYELPNWLLRYSELRGRYIQFSAQSPENARITADQLNGIENSIKVRRKQLDALHEDALFDRKRAEEANLRQQIASSTELRSAIGDPWADITRAEAVKRGLYLPYINIEQGAGFQGRLVTYARSLVRGAEERPKPNSERFREYTDAALKRIEQQLGASVPVYPELEILRLDVRLRTHARMVGTRPPDGAPAAVEGVARGTRPARGRRARNSPTPPSAWRCGRAAPLPSTHPPTR